MHDHTAAQAAGLDVRTRKADVLAIAFDRKGRGSRSGGTLVSSFARMGNQDCRRCRARIGG
jgi:hypothetical protein